MTSLAFPDARLCPTSMYPTLQPKLYSCILHSLQRHPEVAQFDWNELEPGQQDLRHDLQSATLPRNHKGKAFLHAKFDQIAPAPKSGHSRPWPSKPAEPPGTPTSLPPASPALDPPGSNEEALPYPENEQDIVLSTENTSPLLQAIGRMMPSSSPSLSARPPQDTPETTNSFHQAILRAASPSISPASTAGGRVINNYHHWAKSTTNTDSRQIHYGRRTHQRHRILYKSWMSPK